MLYNLEELKSISFEKAQIPVNRYCFKFDNNRNEIRKLKAHEKDFFFSKFLILRNLNGELSSDLYETPEAYEFSFNEIILIHNSDLDFTSPVLGSRGILHQSDIEKIRSFSTNIIVNGKIQ